MRRKRKKANNKLESAFDEYPKKGIIIFQGKKRKYKTIINYFLNEVIKVNTEIDKILFKLKRFNFKPAVLKFEKIKKRKGFFRLPIGYAWEVSTNSDSVIFKNKEIVLNKVDSFSLKKETEKIIERLNYISRHEMGSKSILYLVFNKETNEGFLEVENEDY